MPVLSVSPTIYTEWQITDFNSLSEETDYCLYSPDFSLSGASWFITIYDSECPNFIGLYLNVTNSVKVYRVSFRIGIKRADGAELEYFEDERTFDTMENPWWGVCELIERSAINNTQNILSSDGSLTVFCSIRILNESFILPAKEVASQTSSSTATTLEAATQTPLPDTILKSSSQTPSQASNMEGAYQTSLQSPSLDSMLTLVEDFQDIYRSKLYTDVTFTVKGEKFSVHKSILASRSPVFASMFKHDFAEKSSGSVEITDCEPDFFDLFLLFLYTGKIDDMTTSKAVHLYVTADKYNVNELKEKCVQCMVSGVSIDSFCDVLHLAVMHNNSDLLVSATDFFINNLEFILPTTKWLDFLTEHPQLCNELLIEEVKHRKVNDRKVVKK